MGMNTRTTSQWLGTRKRTSMIDRLLLTCPNELASRAREHLRAHLHVLLLHIGTTRNSRMVEGEIAFCVPLARWQLTAKWCQQQQQQQLLLLLDCFL